MQALKRSIFYSNSRPSILPASSNSESDVEAVIEFFRKNGFKEAESALKEDMMEKCDLGSFDYEKFLFPVLPPVRIPTTLRRHEVEEHIGGDERSSRSSFVSSSSSDDEFVSLGSSTTGVCSSDFTNPYGRHSASRGNSDASSDSLSQFDTARDYPDYDMQNDIYWHDEKDEGSFLTPCFGGPDFFGCPSEDKFIMTLDTEKQFENSLVVYDQSEGLQSETSIDYLDKPCLVNIAPLNSKNEVQVTDYSDSEKNNQHEGVMEEMLKNCAAYGCSEGFVYGEKLEDYGYLSSKETDLYDLQMKVVGGSSTDCDLSLHCGTKNTSGYSIKRESSNEWTEGFKDTSNFHVKDAKKDFMSNGIDGFDIGDFEFNGLHEPKSDADGDDVNAHDLLMYDNHEEEYEIFNLRIIHRKNRTGFEEDKDLPIVLNTVIAGRYYVTEYLGSAAFSKVFQAHDLHTGLDVCLKIIKNDKDFFDQSLDEIKLLKLVNKHDPGDERHILRLFDYFYHQEHLFIVCELLRANLYEFQKFNQESGGEAYFTLSRLQVITRQCLEALEYLHNLGILHCDLKPENILIKSYKRCEIKIIDLGSSCFETDNLCLYVQSRSYRAPEVILGLPYDQKIDLWSLGCILAELCSGEVLFPNDAVVMILARMIGMLGPIDLEMLVNGQETYKYFTKEYDLFFVNEETDQLEYIIPEESSLEHQLQVSDAKFIDFIRNLLEINPQRRPTAREALEHPWLLHSY
ncbi:serine/threonine-protein kinase minibrain isoform X1 [Pistacia vera]|uniref:serine/threonine-protein kinase minibrain isoform X1 n=1 Tax=Pistacia vera TaxID=55513 RepID=UPI001262FECE|nr:serine/threonine-protein kinase minibrain isoform X1 [Pistacia vera]